MALSSCVTIFRCGPGSQDLSCRWGLAYPVVTPYKKRICISINKNMNKGSTIANVNQFLRTLIKDQTLGVNVIRSSCITWRNKNGVSYNAPPAPIFSGRAHFRGLEPMHNRCTHVFFKGSHRCTRTTNRAPFRGRVRRCLLSLAGTDAWYQGAARFRRGRLRLCRVSAVVILM